MLTNQAFNALLKTLEEPPEHVKFLLATTEANKLPATVLSRCVQFNLKSMSVNVLTDHLAHILGEEKIEYEDGALQYVARVADGSVRDSLSLIEQVAALGEGQVQVSVVEQLLGVLSPDRVLELLQLVAAGDAAGCLAHTRVVDEFSPDYRQLLADMLSVFHQVAVHQMVPESATALDRWDRDAVLELSAALSAEHVQLCYDLVLQGQRDMLIAPHPRESFEMTLLRMLFFKPATVDPDLVSAAVNSTGSSSDSSSATATADASQVTKASSSVSSASTASEPLRLDGDAAGTSTQTTEKGVAQAPITDPNPTGLQYPTSATALSSATNSTDRPTQEQHAGRVSDTPLIAPDGGAAKAPTLKAADNPVAENLESAGESVVVKDMPLQAHENTEPSLENSQQRSAALDLCAKHWLQLAENLPLKGMAAELAANTGFLSYDNNKLAISIEVSHEDLNRPLARGQFEQALKRTENPDLVLEIVTGQHSMETLAQQRLRHQHEAQLAAEASIADDPLVRKLIDRTDGEVVKESIQPVVNRRESETAIQRTAEISE